MAYKVHIKLYKITGLVVPRPVIVSELCTQNVRSEYIITEMWKWDFYVFEKLLLSRKYWPRDVKLFQNLDNIHCVCAEIIGRQ